MTAAQFPRPTTGSTTRFYKHVARDALLAPARWSRGEVKRPYTGA